MMMMMMKSMMRIMRIVRWFIIPQLGAALFLPAASLSHLGHISPETKTDKKDRARDKHIQKRSHKTNQKYLARHEDIQKRSRKRPRHTKKIPQETKTQKKMLQETRTHKKDPERLTKNPPSNNEKFPNETRTKIPKDTQKDPARHKDVQQISRKRQGHT